MNSLNPADGPGRRKVVAAFKAMRRDGVNTNVLTHAQAAVLLDVYAWGHEPSAEIQAFIDVAKAAKMARLKARKDRKRAIRK